MEQQNQKHSVQDEGLEKKGNRKSTFANIDPLDFLSNDVEKAKQHGEAVLLHKLNIQNIKDNSGKKII